MKTLAEARTVLEQARKTIAKLQEEQSEAAQKLAAFKPRLESAVRQHIKAYRIVEELERNPSIMSNEAMS